MAETAQIQFRRGTKAQHTSFVGAPAEITVDTTDWTIRLHDGVTAGGKVVGRDLTTSDITEGSRLYFTPERTRAALSAGGALSYNAATGQISYTAPVASLVSAGLVQLSDAINSTSTSMAATPNAVRQAYDLAAAPPWTSISGKPTTLAGFGIVDAQPLDATLSAIAGVPTAADQLLYMTGTDAAAATGLSAFGRSLIDDSNASTARATLGLGAGDPVTFGNLTVSNLSVNGTTTTFNSTVTTIDDPIITLGGDTASDTDDNKDRGIEFHYHNGTTAQLGFFGFDDSDSRFKLFTAATNTSEVFSGTLGDIQATTFYGALSGNAATASAWTTGRTIALTGDVTGTSAAWTGSGNLSFAATLANTTVAPAAYGSATQVATFTVDAKGRLTVAGNVTVTPAYASITGKPTAIATHAFTDVSAFALTLLDDTSAPAARTTLGIDSDDAVTFGTVAATTFTGALAGNATTASAWTTGRTISLTGDVTGTSAAWTGSGNISIATSNAASGVTLAHMADIASGTILGRISAGTGDPEALTGGQARTVLGIDSDDAVTFGTVAATTFTGALAGNATSATSAAAWTTGRTISLTGDLTGTSAAWTGSGNLSFATTLAASGVPAGTYSRVTVDAKGRVTGGSTPVITGTASQTTVQNGDGSGNPTIALADNLTLPGVIAVTVPRGTTAQRPVSPDAGMTRFNQSNDTFEFYQTSQWVPYVPGIAGGGAARGSISANIPAQTGTAIIPYDNTVPLITEGAQIFSQTVYPASTLSRFDIAVNFTVDSSANQRSLICALFRNTTCISVVAMTTSQSGKLSIFSILVTDGPNATGATTYSARFGGDSAMTWYINSSTTPLFGGMLAGNGWRISELT